MSYRVVHVVQQLSRGGAGRALLAMAREAARLDGGTHAIVSLLPAERGAAALASQAGVSVATPGDGRTLHDWLADADVVQIEFWNTPELDALLRDWSGPARVVLWSHVTGDTRPHVLTDAIAGYPDVLVVSCQYSLDLPVCRRTRPDARLVASPADLSRLDHASPRPHEGFVVGYVGTVDPVKLHHEFVTMSAAIDVPGIRVAVYGSGSFTRLRAEADSRGVAGRFDFRGYVEDVGSALAGMDVFGYPLAAGNYATSELALQEAMYLGVPAVVFAHGTGREVVRHGETGLVVRSAEEYVAAIEYLYRQPDERRRLGAQAARHARATFGADRSAAAFISIYEDLRPTAKRMRSALATPAHVGGPAWPASAAGAARFAHSLGELAADFIVSATGGDDDRLSAERRLARMHPALADAAAGGVLHYRRAYPHDRLLRLWSGLALQSLGRHALAVGEFRAAIDLGEDHWRTWWHLERSARCLDATDLARDAAAVVARAGRSLAPFAEPDVDVAMVLT